MSKVVKSRWKQERSSNDCLKCKSIQLDYMEFQSQKAYLLEHFQEYRIVQPTVVFIHGLPKSFSQVGVLQRQLLYLGNTFRINIQFISKDFYSAFVQFEANLSAALLIVMLNEMTLCNRQLRVFYGSTKFCPHFLKNHQCHLSNCNYAHYYIPHLTHLRDQAKEIDHNGIANLFIYQQFYQSVQIIRRILCVKEGQRVLLSLGKERLENILRQYSFNVEPIPPRVQAIEKEEVEWTSLEKEIESQTSSNSEEKKEENASKPVQQFLDAAQRFLTKLIFESSVFVY